MRKNKLAVFGLAVVCLLAILCLASYLWPRLTGYSYEQQNLVLGPSSPSSAHWLGTDQLGRDMLARLLYGGGISLMVGLCATVVSLTIGVFYGAIAGFAGGKLDMVMMRIVDILYALPFPIFVILLMVFFGQNIILLFVAIGAVEWLTMARIVRGQVMAIKRQEFVEAAHALGLKRRRIVFRHIVPNLLGPIIVYATLTVPEVILLESFLSFLGLGVQPPQSSWGSLIKEGADMMEEYPWMLLYPGAVMALTLFSLNFLGDGLRDALERPGIKGLTMPLLNVEKLCTAFHTRNGVVRAVQDVSFQLERGETLGIVGESGSGKSVTCYSIMGLIPQPPGRIEGGRAMFDDIDLLACSHRQLNRIRGRRISMIFQDAMTSLNPFLRIGEQLIEPLLIHEKISRTAATDRALAMMNDAGIAEAEHRLKMFPHEFSGGMRQRVMIAMALITKPDLLIADEPTTALDVTVQAQILELIKKMQQELGMAVILISHDLGIVSGFCNRVMVMYGGRVMESAPTEDLFYDTQHPYTRGLRESIPALQLKGGELHTIPGQPPDPHHSLPGCPFAPRCSHVVEDCGREEIVLTEVKPKHGTACLRVQRENLRV